MDNNKINDLGKKIINAVRCNPNQSKTQLSDFLGVPWSSVSSTIKTLSDKNIINIKDINNNCLASPSKLSRAVVTLNSFFEIYVGISLGNSHIKMVFMDFSFNLINKEYFQANLSNSSFDLFCNTLESLGFNEYNEQECIWCKNNPDDIFELRETIIKIASVINELKTDKINITAICFSFPGHIDYDNQIIISTLGTNNSLLKNSNIYMFLTSSVSDKLEKNNIQCFIDHNVKSSAIAEKESLEMKKNKYNPNNMLVLYLGRGVSSALILNSALFRGDYNSAGELGDNIFTIEIDGSFKTQSFESFIKNEVFNGDDMSKSSIDLANILKEKNDKKRLLIEILATCLYNVVNNLGINTILFSGKFSKIFPLIEVDLNNKFQSMGKLGLTLMQSNYGEYSAAVGAAMSCYYNIYKIPFKWY